MAENILNYLGDCREYTTLPDLDVDDLTQKPNTPNPLDPYGLTR